MPDIANFTRITALALADSVNPCAIAILAMILITILIHNPEKKHKVLYAGLAFVFSVFIGYLFLIKDTENSDARYVPYKTILQ